MIDVLKTTKYVADNSKLVKISTRAIEKLVNSVQESELDSFDLGYFGYNWPFDLQMELVFIFNAVNFCYWSGKGEQKWTVEIGGKKLDGAIALFKCLEEEANRNDSFFRPETLANLNENDLKRILRGNAEIPLFDERLECLRELGQVTKDRYGDYLKIIENSEHDAMKLVETITINFPRFNDVSEYSGKSIGFYKRAQLNVNMINSILVSVGQAPMLNIDKLTAFADYKVPQILRGMGIVKYSNTLSKKIDDYELIPVNSREEVEIRANTVWAVELIREELSKTFPVTSPEVDTVLWTRSQKKEPGEKPYHRTLTTAY
ncbi:MAG: queuosine salvage family protein [Candidatus Shapirobacteria bacterium]|jgi:hypothetical protein